MVFAISGTPRSPQKSSKNDQRESKSAPREGTSDSINTHKCSEGSQKCSEEFLKWSEDTLEVILGTSIGEKMLYKRDRRGPQSKIMLCLRREHGFCDPRDPSKSSEKFQK